MTEKKTAPAWQDAEAAGCDEIGNLKVLDSSVIPAEFQDDPFIHVADAWQEESKRLATKMGGNLSGLGVANGWQANAFTAAELFNMRFPAVSWVIPSLLPEGLTIAAGRPKVGKSWLALDIAVAVAAGSVCLGGKQPDEGDVLYAALEDNPRRLQNRMDRITPLGASWPERLTLTNSWRRLDQGGVEDIGEWADTVETPRLVILDTLAGVKPIRTNSGYTEDYASLEALHRLANERGLAILVLHHTRKMEADDPLDTVSGTLGLAGCADTVLVIARNSQGTTLYLRGRDIEEAEHAVDFDKESCRWSILGTAAEVHRSEQRKVIADLLADNPEPMTPSEIADATGQSANNTKQLLFKMAKDGQLRKVGRGKYAALETPGNFDNPITNEAGHA